MRRPADELNERRTAGLLRHLREIASRDAATLTLPGGDQLINFGSNDTLGLSHYPCTRDAAAAALEQHGTGTGASRLVSGSLALHHRLEHDLANAKSTEAALTFATGYAAALGTLTALLRPGDTVILDKLCHACLIDGARLSGATIRVFPHNNTERLRKLLESTRPGPDQRVIICVESVYSMDGDLAPLGEICDLRDEFGVWLLVDEAHAFGLHGPSGMGIAEKHDLQGRIDLQMGTLSKAAGSAGGYLCASGEIIDLLVNSARSFIYSTAPPPAQAAASIAAIEWIRSPQGTEARTRLKSRISQLTHSLGLPAHGTHIVPHLIGDSETALALSKALLDHGMFVPAIRFPTVPRKTARLRISLTSTHTEEQITRLTRTLAQIQQ